MWGLSPVLSLGASYTLDDKDTLLFPGTYLTKTEIKDFSLGVSKAFSTGTTAVIKGGIQNRFLYSSLDSINPYPSTGYLSLGISQSLWKDGFGQLTSLRRDRESSVYTIETLAQELKYKQLRQDAENAYWTWVYEIEDVRASRLNLERAKRLESWVSRRLNNGIGDRSDLLGARSLLVSRELQLNQAMDNLKAAESKMNDLLEGHIDITNLEPTSNLFQKRSPSDFISGQGDNIYRIDILMAAQEAKLKGIMASEVSASLEADLKLNLTYQTNSLESNIDEALGKIGNTKYPTYFAGLTWSWIWETEAKSAARNSAKFEALAAKLNSERKINEGKMSYKELIRRHGELTKTTDWAKRAADYQLEKAKFEQEKLLKGRSVTSQVITAEQDAQEAQLNYLRLSTEQRKLESSGQLYIRTDME
jgi:outer membrane protein TolC